MENHSIFQFHPFTIICTWFLPRIFLLPESERDVAVLDHVQDLPLHSDEEESDPVEQQDGPEDRDVKDGEEGHHERDANGLRQRIPEFELGQTADEGFELVTAFGG